MGIEELLNPGEEAEEVEEGAPAWMATFADMSTLLLTFFVLLLSFANMDAQKFREMLGSVQDAFGVQKETFGDYMQRSSQAIDFSLSQSAGEGSDQESDQSKSLREALSIIESLRREEMAQSAGGQDEGAPSMEQALSIIQAVFEGLGGYAEVFLDEGGVTVRVEGKLLFSSGTAELKPRAQDVLQRVAALLEKYTFDLYILGHTDPVPIETPQFPSNWELSSARAAAALRYLVGRGADPQRLVSVGFADSRPIAENATPEGRARNRRVEFLFKNPETLPSGGFKPAQP